MAVHRPARSHFDHPAPPDSDPDLSDDDNHGEGSSSGFLRGLGGSAVRANTVAALLEESVKFVPERLNRGEQAIPWEPINKKVSTCRRVGGSARAEGVLGWEHRSCPRLRLGRLAPALVLTNSFVATDGLCQLIRTNLKLIDSQGQLTSSCFTQYTPTFSTLDSLPS